jgi:hypothetical protein
MLGSPREGALIKGVPVVFDPDRGDKSEGSMARREPERVKPLVLPPLEPGLPPSSAEDENRPPLKVLAVGISCACEPLRPSWLDVLPPRFRFSLSTSGLVGVSGVSGVAGATWLARFSPSSSLCFNIFFLKSNHVLLMASLSYWEKGLGGCLRAVEAPVAGGGNGDSGSSIARGEV